MASYYVRSGAGGAATGANWANAYLTLAAAFSGKAAGDIFYVSEDHAETQASAMTLTSPGTISNPCFVYGVNHAGSVPPVSADLLTGATISTTGASNITFGTQSTYYKLLGFSAGSAASAANIVMSQTNTAAVTFDACAWTLNNTAASAFNFSAAGGSIQIAQLFKNCTFTFGSNVGQSFLVAGNSCLNVRIIGGSVAVGANVPTTLFVDAPPLLLLQGVDLSVIGSGKTLIGDGTTAQCLATLVDCKLGSGVTVAATQSAPSKRVNLIRADSSATNYRTESYHYTGTQTVETTIVRTGGATDGTTPIAWKLVTTANSKWVLPFEAMPLAVWNDSTSAITTLTIYGTTTGGGVPKDDEIWVEVEYLGAAGNPQGSFITSSKADNLAASAATNNSSDASTWGGSGAGNGFKIVVPSFTPGMKGPITITVKAAKASSTYYIDPKPSISGVTVSKSEILAPGVYANELSSGGGGLAANPLRGFVG